MASCPLAIQLKLEDQIPFVDAEGSCDGSISSVGTGSILGHSTTSEEYLDKNSSQERLWKYHQNHQDSSMGDHHSLNNILDTVTSSHTRLTDLDYCSVDQLNGSHMNNSHESIKIESHLDTVVTIDEPMKDECKTPSNNGAKHARPNTLILGKDVKGGFVSLTSAYASLTEQLSDNYESIYNSSVSYGCNGQLSPTKSIHSAASTSSPSQPHHYISSYRIARTSLSRRTGSKVAATTSASSSSSSSTLDRVGVDPSHRLQTILRQRYQKLCDSLPAVSWCPDFHPPVRQMIFSLARDSSWEKGTATPQRPNLRRIPLHGIFAEDRRSDRPKSGGQRLLIMGETGYGKTTLLLRLLNDWSTQDPALGYLARFKLVYFVPCRDLTGQRVNLFGSPSKDETELAISLAPETENQTLFLLDGLDELNIWPDEIKDLLEGRLYPASTVLATSRPVPVAVAHPAFHKRIIIHGFELVHVESFIRSFFATPHDLERDQPPAMMDLLQARPRLMKLASNPLMCFLLCLVFQEEGGRLPESAAELFGILMRFVMLRSLRQSQQQGHMTTQQRKILLDFGRLTLQGIKENRYIYTDTEIKSACQTLDIVKWGFLLKGINVNVKGQKRTFYQPIHSAWSEYAAALYLASVSHYANIIQREVYSLPLDAEPCLTTSAGIYRSSLQVLFFLCSVLSKKAYLLYNILSPLDFPCVTLLSFLQTAGRSNVNVAALCKLIQGHASVTTSAESQLQSWSALVDHPECLLHSMAIRYDGLVNGPALASLVDVVGRNSTLHTLKISSVIGQGLEAVELSQVARQLGPMMSKPKLQTLELAISSFDEDVSIADALQPLVDALCSSIGKTAISKLVLDMELSAEQVTQLGQVLPTSSVRSLHLLHLSCAWDGLQALTCLINNAGSSVTGLDLSGCWAATSSASQTQQTVVDSPTACGTLSGSSSCSTGSPVATPTPDPLNHHSPRPTKQQQQFLSLPRRPTRGSRSYSSLTRAGQQNPQQGLSSSSNYLSRTDEKRRSDSMLFQKVLLPLPACDRSSHLQCGFHLLFEALRHPSCRLTQLNLSKSSLSVSDAMCLGESLRKNRVLVSLRLEGLSSLKEVLPVCLSLAENKALQLLDVSSNHVLVNDSAFQLICRALGRNCSLQSLRMCGWTFCLEEEDTFKTLSDAVQTSRLRELALSSSLIRIPFQDKRSRLSSALLGPVMLDELVALMSQEGFDQVRSDWLAFLKLDNCRLELNSKLTLRGAHLVFFTSGFQRLSEVNLALDASSTTEPLRDKASLAFFQSLSQSCSQLRTLVLNNWKFQWSKPDKVLKGIAKSLKNMSLSCISLDGLVLQADQPSSVAELAFALVLVSTLNNLTLLSLNGWRFSNEDSVDLGKAIRDKLSSNVLELSLKNVPSQTTRLIVKVAEETGRVAVSRGSSAGLYRFKKTGRAPGFLNKMMLITSSWKE